MKRSILLSALAGVVVLLAQTTAFAGAVSVNFESYTPGSVDGQDGWGGQTPPGIPINPLIDQEVVAGHAAAPASFGTKSWRISNAYTSGSFGDQTFSKPLPDEAGEASAANDGMSSGPRHNHFEAKWDFISTTPGAPQGDLYVVASPDRGDGARMSWVEMYDDPSTGVQVNFYDYQSGVNEAGCVNGDNFVFTNVASGLSRTVPHTIRLTMDFVSGPANDVVKVYVDGALLHTGTSWEDYFRECEGNPTRTVDQVLFRVGGLQGETHPANRGNGWLIDNLSESTTTLVGPPTNKDQCKKDGWKSFNNPSFKNQGDCIQYVNTGK